MMALLLKVSELMQSFRSRQDLALGACGRERL